MTVGIFDPACVADEIADILTTHLENSPRSLQTLPGPSEIGGCRIKLVHKIAGDREPYRTPSLAAFIGTCFHTGMEAAVRDSEIYNACIDEPRFLLEHKVRVGEAGGHEIWGSVDGFDKDAGIVWDYKLVGHKSHTEYRLRGPSAQYRVQAHLYGRGMVHEGWPVNHVMILFYKRNGLHPKDRLVWHEPYDESIALRALSRLNGLYQLVAELGKDAVIAGIDPCSSPWCPWCRAAEIPTTAEALFGNTTTPGTTVPRSRNAAALFGAGKELVL